ncbi:MAG: methionyl-tRNA formyltransferase [Desulfovibrio sp.]|nr:methionyl-tRNA formyltransferase [Desulfovibrio sp.]
MVEKPGLILMGSSGFSAIVLQNLLEAGQRIRAVYTMPDKKAGRGMKKRESPVKILAQENSIPVFQPASFRDPGTVAELGALKPDFLVVAAYGLLLPEAVLSIPKIAPLNIHPSLLPLYRGAAPIQRAIQENWTPDAETGVSIMKLVRELDAGPVYAQRKMPIGRASYFALSDALAHAGSQLLLETLPAIQNGLLPEPQDDTRATYATKLDRGDGRINWQDSAAQVDALIRAVNPWPGARTEFGIEGSRIQALIREARPGEEAPGMLPGQIQAGKGGLAIACGDKWLEIGRIQLEGRKETSGRDFVNGLRLSDQHRCFAF